MIDTILIPIDGSSAARKALTFGSDLAARYGARIVLLHVLLRHGLADTVRGLSDLERITGESLEKAFEAHSELRLCDVVRSSEESQRQVLEIIARQVVKVAEAFLRSRGLNNFETVVEDGDVTARILECAERKNADVIVMGSRGLSNLEGLLLGSTSHKVCHLARCTCITVR